MSRSRRTADNKRWTKVHKRVKKDARKGLRHLRRVIQEKLRQDLHADVPLATHRSEVADIWHHD